MSAFLSDQTIAILAWIFAIGSFSFASYIFSLNWKHLPNRWVSLLLVLVGVNQAATGFLVRAGDLAQAALPLILISITTLMFLPVMVIVTLGLLKLEWLKEGWKWAKITQWMAVALAALPGILILFDVLIGTQKVFGFSLLYSGLDGTAAYLGGFIPFTQVIRGLLSPVLIGVNFFTLYIFLLLFCLFIAIIDSKPGSSERLLAWIIFAALGVWGGTLVAFRSILESSLGVLSSISLIALLFGVLCLLQMAMEQYPQRGHLTLRLSLLLLSVIVPVLLGLVLVMTALQTTPAVSFVMSLAGLLVLSGLVWLTVRQGLKPLRSMIGTASVYSEGRFSKEVPFESEDELGLLATAYNRLVKQSKELNATLEDRVAERTASLERRNNQLRAAAFVSREAASIRDVHQLLTQTVQLISHHFDFYHAGIFLMDDSGEYAVLQAANSEGGQRMLARGHKLRVGQVGIVGYVADVGSPRIALNVGEDAVYFNNPDLPLTRSEVALPLRARGQVIGVLDVQSIEEAAFSNDDVEILQVMADQVALALDHARLLNESRVALEELRNLYGQRTRLAWRERLSRGALSYRYSPTGLNVGEDQSGDGTKQPDDTEFVTDPVLRMKDGQQELLIPIILRGQILGKLVLRRDQEQNPWSQDELSMAMDMVTQVLPALENARLLEEIQNRAQVERLVGQVSSRIQSSLDLETVLKTAVQEIGMVVNATRVQISLEKGEKEG